TCLEAMAYGKPVVATAVGGLLDLVVDGETGLLVPARDGPALRGAVERLLGDRDLRRRLGAAGRARAQEFEWSRVVPRLLAYYDRPYDHAFSLGPTYGAHREALELSFEEYRELQAYAREQGIAFFATAWDFESADLLAELDVPAFKIASGDLLNTPLQRHVASFGKPVFLSTGGGSMDDVERAVETIFPINEQLCVLQCTAAYR